MKATYQGWIRRDTTPDGRMVIAIRVNTSYRTDPENVLMCSLDEASKELEKLKAELSQNNAYDEYALHYAHDGDDEEITGLEVLGFRWETEEERDARLKETEDRKQYNELKKRFAKDGYR